jgi:dihydrodipicolinate synthase/N-acetylneuraminate lyase
MKFDLKGSIVALITPFHEDGSVNFEKLHELLEWHVANHTDGILVLGTTGESSTMTHEEDDAVVDLPYKRLTSESRSLSAVALTVHRQLLKKA